MRVDKANPVFVLFAYHDALGALEHHAKQRAQPRRPRPDHQHGILPRDVGDARRPVPGGQHIAHQQRLPIRHAVRNFVQPLIRKGHPHIFRLPAVYAAAERPAAVLIRAVVDIALFAEKAFAAKRLHVDRHAIPRLDMGDPAPHRLDDAHHLVADRHARNRAGNASVLDVQIARADAGERHLHNRVPLVQERRLGLFHQFEFSL